MIFSHSLLDSLLLATHDANGEIRVYRLRIDFERNTTSIQNLSMLPSCTPFASVNDAAQASNDPADRKAQLTLIEFIPAGPDSKTREPTPPSVLVAFSYVSHQFQGAENANTVICKWDLILAKSSLHPAFSDLSSRKNGPSALADLPVSRSPNPCAS